MYTSTTPIWNEILEKKIELPTPVLQLYNHQGMPTRRVSGRHEDITDLNSVQHGNPETNACGDTEPNEDPESTLDSNRDPVNNTKDLNLLECGDLGGTETTQHYNGTTSEDPERDPENDMQDEMENGDTEEAVEHCNVGSGDNRDTTLNHKTQTYLKKSYMLTKQNTQRRS